jgi:hypothetical protein
MTLKTNDSASLDSGSHINALDRVIEVVDLTEVLGQQKAVVGREIALSRLCQLVPLGAQPPARQIGEGVDISLPGNEGF